MATDKSYGSIEEQTIEEEPVDTAHDDLPDPEGLGVIDPDTRRRLEASQAADRRRRERAEREAELTEGPPASEDGEPANGGAG